jgi:3-methyladenine DNA glycosylase AlkC
MTSWEQEFQQYLIQEKIDNAITFIEKFSSNAENFSLADKDRALHIIENHLANLDQAREWLDKLLANQNPIAREVGALLAARLIPALYPHNRQEVREILARIADDPNWEVRESVAHVYLQLLKVDENAAFSLLNEWVKHPSENIRRAAAITIKKIGKERRTEWGTPLLDLIEPLLCDRSRYVCKNLGPFAIGDGLLRYYPQLTLERLEHWSTWEDGQVLWNVAMVFSASEGAKHLDEAINILDRLARDERRYVWRSVASAMRNLGRRSPERIMPVLKRWLEDPMRSSPAQVALKYLT